MQRCLSSMPRSWVLESTSGWQKWIVASMTWWKVPQICIAYRKKLRYRTQTGESGWGRWNLVNSGCAPLPKNMCQIRSMFPRFLWNKREMSGRCRVLILRIAKPTISMLRFWPFVFARRWRVMWPFPCTNLQCWQHWGPCFQGLFFRPQKWGRINMPITPYCWWKKICTTWNVKTTPPNNGINYQPQVVIAGFLNHQPVSLRSYPFTKTLFF